MRPLRIGLTGGIGSGKSTVGSMLAALGAALIDTDAMARQLTEPGGAAIEPIRAAFGDSFIDANGALARPAMRALAFSDPSARRRLEAILQPRVHESAETAEAITLVERARRRMGGSAEALREVALAGPQADPRFPGEEQSLAARALGFINQAEKVQLKLAPGNLRPGGTWDAALETLMQLDLLDAVLAHVSGADPVRHAERQGQSWPAMGTLLLARIDECVAAAGAFPTSS